MINIIFQKWISFAEADLDAAKRLIESPRPSRWTYLLALWHCHQTIEKSLKAMLVKQEKEILKIHDLPHLSQLVELGLSEEQKSLLEELNTFYLRSRYPDIMYAPLPDPNKTFTKKLFSDTKKLLLWLKKQ